MNEVIRLNKELPDGKTEVRLYDESEVDVVRTKILYFCVGCRQVHYDNDYCEADGDLVITNWNNFLESVERIKDLVVIK